MASILQKQAMRWARKSAKKVGKAAPAALDKLREQAAPCIKKAAERGLAPSLFGRVEKELEINRRLHSDVQATLMKVRTEEPEFGEL